MEFSESSRVTVAIFALTHTGLLIWALSRIATKLDNLDKSFREHVERIDDKIDKAAIGYDKRIGAVETRVSHVEINCAKIHGYLGDDDLGRKGGAS